MEPSLKILPDVSGEIAGRSLEEWNAAYVKVENYFHALRIRNKPLLGQLVLRVLERAQRRAPAELERSATEIAAEEMDRLVTELVRGSAASLAHRHRPDALHARPPRAAARRHAGQMAGSISPAGSVAAGICRRHARKFFPRRPGFPIVQNDAASAGPRPDHHAHQFRQAALRPHGAGLALFCPAAGGSLLAHPWRIWNK